MYTKKGGEGREGMGEREWDGNGSEGMGERWGGKGWREEPYPCNAINTRRSAH
jgi:hypothetical protein